MVNKKLAIGVSVLLFFIVTFGVYSFFSGKNSLKMLSPLNLSQTTSSPTSPNATVPTKVDTEPKTEECPINGALYSKNQRSIWEKRRPLGIMVENHLDARPQSGLSSADVIYEVVAEGGITRFLNIFYCQDANPVGPVRSARIYFLKLLESYGLYPLYAHVGGANTPGPADALGYINTIGWGLYNDLNQFAVPFPYYWRDYERLPNRATEHTVYTATSKLWDYAKTKRKLTNLDDDGVAWDKGFIKWQFTDDESLEKRGTVNKINFSFWTSFANDYAVEWKYNKATNSYLRLNGGKPHIDNNTKKQLEAKNVIVVFADESPARDGYEGGHILYDLLGTGKAIIFQNGNAVVGSWKKKTDEAMMRFYDETGAELSLVRGKDFVEILPTGNKVTY